MPSKDIKQNGKVVGTLYTPTEDTPTPQGGLAHISSPMAINNQVDNRHDAYYDQALLRIKDLEPFLLLAEEMRELAIAGRINDMRRRLVVFTVTQGIDLAKNSPETTSADTQIRPREHKKQELERGE